jgi:anaerobic selenocysteine-containing dehydrogenase
MRNSYHKGEMTWEEDGYTVTRTYNWSAPGCHNSCGVLYYTKNGKLEKVEGDPYDPWVNGKLCMRCLDMPEIVNHEQRLQYPVKRVGERGENKWERITWEEALDTVEKYIVEEIDGKGFGRESIVVNHGTGRNINWQVPLIAGACFGTANAGGVYFSGWSCYTPRVCASAGPLGNYPLLDASENLPARYADPEWQPPDVLIVWGQEPLKSNADGFMGHWLNICHQLGTKIVSIDPQLTWWGARAEYWLPVIPGTDVCLALAMCNIIISENLVDTEFIDNWVAYYDEFKEHVSQFTPEWAAEHCGVPVEDIIGVARLFAAAERGAIQWGLAFDASTASAMHLVQATVALMAITGNIEKPGTHMLVRNAFEMDAGYGTIDIYARPEAFAKKFSNAMCGLEGKDFMGMANPDAMAKALETGDPYPIKLFWAQGTNAFSGHEEPAPRAYKYLKEIPFIVFLDVFINPSAVALADMVLPLAMSVERSSARVWWSPLREMRKAIENPEVKSDEEIAIWLGKRLNPELFKRWDNAEELINDYMLYGLNKTEENGKVIRNTSRWSVFEEADDGRTSCPVNFDQLYYENDGFLFDEWDSTYNKHEKGLLRPDGLIGFNTPSGRIELIPFLFQIWGIPQYPVYTPVSVGRDSTPELMEEYPFYFINGARSYEFFHTEHRQSATMREFHPEPIVKISPKAAEEYDLKDGDWIWMENEDGRCMQMVKVFPGMPKYFLSCEHGWWKPEEEGASPHLFGCFNYNPNNLTHAYETGPGGIGAPVKCLICKIYKVKEGDVMPCTQVVELGGFRDYEPGRP